MKLLIIRPEPGASASAARARSAGFEAVLLPFFEIRPRSWTVPPGQHDALLLTSANAVRHAGSNLRQLAKLPIHAVGSRTADAARAAGLQIASTGSTGIEEALARAAHAEHRRLLWLAGEDHKRPASVNGIHVEIAICYASSELVLPDNAASIIAGADVVALHSPRAAQHFCATLDRLALGKSALFAAAFSPAVAKAAGKGWKGIAVAATPTDAAMLSALTKLVKPITAREKQKDA